MGEGVGLIELACGGTGNLTGIGAASGEHGVGHGHETSEAGGGAGSGATDSGGKNLSPSGAFRECSYNFKH